MIKFRSMRRDAEGETGPIWASDHDARCTRIGDWLRHTNIDELPQLVNVLRGEMSLVGPRPERPIFVEQFREPGPRLRPPPRRARRHDRLGPGPRLARPDVAPQADPVRPRLHPALVVLARFPGPAHDRPARRLGQDLLDAATERRPGALSRPVCSVVIPTYNGRRLLETCLASIARYRPLGPGDRGDRRRRRLDRRHRRLARRGRIPTSAWSGSSGTPASARRPTRGSPRARGEFVQLLNNDTEVTPGWIEAGLAPFADPTVGSVAPLVLVRSDPSRVDSAGDSLRAGRLAEQARPRPARRPTGSTAPADRVFGASGSSAFYRAEALRRVGGFDPSFGSYYEDVDLAFRLRWAGYDCVFTPRCRILHEVSASYDHARPALQRRMSRNAEILFWTDLPASLARRRARPAPRLHDRPGRLATRPRPGPALRPRQARCLAGMAGAPHATRPARPSGALADRAAPLPDQARPPGRRPQSPPSSSGSLHAKLIRLTGCSCANSGSSDLRPLDSTFVGKVPSTPHQTCRLPNARNATADPNKSLIQRLTLCNHAVHAVSNKADVQTTTAVTIPGEPLRRNTAVGRMRGCCLRLRPWHAVDGCTTNSPGP